MFMKELFVKQFIPEARFVHSLQDNGIFCFENDEELFVLIDVYVAGSFTKSHQHKISSALIKDEKKPPKFITLYRSRADFSSVGEIIWGTYAWLENEPTHFIHFDDNPSKTIS